MSVTYEFALTVVLNCIFACSLIVARLLDN